MKARFEQMNKTVNQLKEANKDNRAGLAHLTQQAEQVGKALDQISDGLQQTMASCQSAANALQQRRQNPTLPTPEQTQASAQKGGQ
jgi:ABC-type transporter Mla subunit MlaD